MSLNYPCPGCKATLTIREEYAGKTMKCPRCGIDFDVPTNLATAVSESPQPAPPPDVGPTKRCPHCGERIAAVAKKCRFCKRWVEEEEEDEPPASPYKPCPRCGSLGAERVLWTFWGSFYGPAIFCHVRCPECRYAYNGRSGGSNLIPAIIFVTVPLLGILFIFAALGFMVYSMANPY